MEYNKDMICILFLVMNVISFILFGIDKYKAVHHKYRIPERILLGSCVIGGCIGGWAGMHVFHHKTLHTLFTIGVPVCCVFWMGIWGYALFAR